MSSTSAEVLREAQRTISGQSKIIARQQKNIHKLLQKLGETGSSEALIDESSSSEDLSLQQDYQIIEHPISKVGAMDLDDVPIVEETVHGQKLKAMLLTPKMTDEWNTVLNLNTKVNTFEKEIKRESKSIEEMLYFKERPEFWDETPSGPSFRGWPQATMKVWFDQAHVRGYTLRQRVCDFLDERDSLHEKLAELVEEVLEKGGLRQPDDPVWLVELQASRIVDFDGNTFHPIRQNL